MVSKTITCPKCGEEFELEEALIKDVESSLKKQFQKNYQHLEKKHSRELAEKEKELIDRFKTQKNTIEERMSKKAREESSLELNSLKDELKDKTERLKKATKKELELMIRQRELSDRERELELDLEKKLAHERNILIKKLADEYEERHRLDDMEKEKQLTDMKKQIEDLRRKAEGGSQKMRGEILEIDFENRLKNEFQFDEIEPVSSGIKGADVRQIVKTQTGQVCGKILWETKRTKAWSDGWIQKLKDDQRAEKADIAVLVSDALPAGFTYFRKLSGIWVSDIPTSISLALALRTVLIQAYQERKMQSGKKEKMELVYDYLTGTEFRNRVEAIVESFVALKTDLDKEKRAMEKIWSKREKQIDRVVMNLSGMHGDLEGIAGKALPVVKVLELPGD